MTGNLNIARTGHTATLLANGKVLVVGGWDYAGVDVPGAELYDPTTGIWTLTGYTKCTAPELHTATLLFDGKVLFAGGGCAELYDPVTGTFTLTGSMNEWRIYHTATRLADGRVLVAGGAMDNWDGTPIGSAEIYDPTSGRWTLTGALDEARFAHTATMLRDGRVLVLGYSSAELYDPNVGVWKNAGALTLSRSYHQATLLPSGKVLVTDGEESGSLSVRDSELFDPTTGTSTVTGGLNVARAIATATLLQSGDVLVAGGILMHSTPTSTVYVPVASAAKYDSTSAQWQSVGEPITPRYRHTATLLQDGRVLVAGGSFVRDTGGIPLASAELYGLFTVSQAGAQAAPNYEGMWGAPGEPGWGMSFTHQGDIIFATWFTYDHGNPTWASMTAQQQSDGSFAGLVYLTSYGAPFNDNQWRGPIYEGIGMGRLTFADTSNVTFTYSAFPQPDYYGYGHSFVKTLTPFVYASPVPVCTFNGPLSATQATNYQGMWVVPNLAEAGWGVTFAHQGDIIFATLFVYVDTGVGSSPFWVSATMTKTAARTYSGALDYTHGPSPSDPFDPSLVTHSTVGSASVTFADGNTGTLTYRLYGVTQTKALTRFVFREPGTVCQ